VKGNLEEAIQTTPKSERNSHEHGVIYATNMDADLH
jgi:hypothetical protein